MALKHHKSLEEYVQILEAIDFEQHGSKLFNLKSCRMQHCDLLTLAGY